MARLHLDETVVARFAGEPRFNVLWDTGLWGFGCRFSARQPPRYLVYFRTRVMAVGCRRFIGSSPQISCDQARRLAQEFIARSAPHQLSRNAAREPAGRVS